MHEGIKDIYTLLDNSRLKEALTQLKAMATQTTRIQTAFRLPYELIARLPGSEVQTETGNQLLLECQQLILTNFSDPDFNIDALAEISGMHRTTLFRIFRRELDTTPQEYLMQCRIDHAVYLLQTTLIPVNIIAESSGFKRSNYFCRIIRSRCGRTPEQLRKHAVYGN